MQIDEPLMFSFLIGLIFGVVLSWLYLFGRLKQSSGTAAEFQSTVALLAIEKTTTSALQTTIQTQATQLAEYKDSLERGQTQASDLNARCAVAESQNARIPILEHKVAEKESEIKSFQLEKQELAAKLAEATTLIAEERKVAAEKLALLDEAQSKLSDAFKALSAEALQNNNDSFINLAKAQLETFHQEAAFDLEKNKKSFDDLVKPLKDGLENVDRRVLALDKARIETYTALNEQVKNLVSVQTALQGETQNLVRALRMPTVRGRWGEIQLKRVVEMAGMIEYCDFCQQPSVESENGQLRPDMTVKLAGQKTVVVDSKTPLEAYLNSIQTTDETDRATHLKEHARQVRSHLQKLSKKAYWDQFEQSPEFVVLFLPGEMFFSAALEQDPELIEAGVKQKVIIATPTTLIALLRAVAYGWTQERLSRDAEEISNLGKKLYVRIRKFTEHMTNLRNHLEKVVDCHNKAVGSLEASVVPAARSLKTLAACAEADIEAIEPIEIMTRSIQSNELLLPGISADEGMT